MLKVGDKVRVVKIINGGEDSIGTISRIVKVDRDDPRLTYMLEKEWWYNDEELELFYDEMNPVKEVKKYLEHGIYGRFFVREENSHQEGINISLVDRGGNDDKTIHILNAEELRNAAKLFNNLADYLEEKNNA